MAVMNFKRVENTVGKGEIARYEQFLLFPKCLQRLVLQTRKKPGLVWERVRHAFTGWGEAKKLANPRHSVGIPKAIQPVQKFYFFVRYLSSPKYKHSTLKTFKYKLHPD